MDTSSLATISSTGAWNSSQCTSTNPANLSTQPARCLPHFCLPFNPTPSHPFCCTAAAQTYDVGAQATLYLTLDTSSLATFSGTGAWNSGQCTSTNPAGCNAGSNLVRIQPPDAAPPQAPPGITISQTTVYTYNVIISKLMTCVDSRTVSAGCNFDAHCPDTAGKWKSLGLRQGSRGAMRTGSGPVLHVS